VLEHDSAAAAATAATAGEKEERDGDGGDGDGALRATDKVLCPSHACFTHGAQFNTHGSVHALRSPFLGTGLWTARAEHVYFVCVKKTATTTTTTATYTKRNG